MFLISAIAIGYFTACIVGGAHDATPYRASSYGTLRGYTPTHRVGTVVDDTLFHLPSLRK